ncbi:flagellin, partial [Candidatus Poribacteria bacterium]|nr:flagellin [Candidatus Poribacteria bacterium]
LRINKAADDAAGLAISDRMNNQVRGMQQANRNVQQGNNMLQTAEGAMNEIGNILGRMRELAVQSASDTVTQDDRSSIDLEFDQLRSEINRIANSTEYNNTKLVDGSKAKTGTAKNVTGSDDGLTLDSTTGISVTSTAAIGTYSITESGGDLTLTLDGTSVAQTVSVAASGEQEVQFDELGITLKLNSNFTAGELGTAGADIEVEGASQDITLQIGADNTSQDRLAFNLGAMTDEGLGISLSQLGGSGATITDAQSAINQLDAAIAKVNDERSNVGALQNRLEFTSSNLMNSIQNNAASMSTIRDADFAAEAADLAKNQILVQSGTSMLAQANSLSQNVLALIR